MPRSPRPRLGGVLLMAAGLCFFVAAKLAGQPGFIGAGAALFLTGAALFRKARAAA